LIYVIDLHRPLSTMGYGGAEMAVQKVGDLG